MKNQVNTEPAGETAADLQAATEKDKTVTAWISLDVEQLRQRDPVTVADTILASAAAIRDNLVAELAKHGIHADRRQLRKRLPSP
jgi:hypothetical protein